MHLVLLPRSAFPQTWEDPSHQHAETKANGDDDPLDVCEIGETIGYVGQVKQVKILGVMALLDEGETDWKVLVIDVNDPLAAKLNDIEDVERHMPGLVRVRPSFFTPRCHSDVPQLGRGRERPARGRSERGWPLTFAPPFLPSSSLLPLLHPRTASTGYRTSIPVLWMGRARRGRQFMADADPLPPLRLLLTLSTSPRLPAVAI